MTTEYNTNLLGTEGLSSTEAQSISNLANQDCLSIMRTIDSINNYETSYVVNGLEYILRRSNALYLTDIPSMLEEVANKRALQAFLMEAIKHKQDVSDKIVNTQLDFDLEYPKRASYPTSPSCQLVDANWGFKQLSQIEQLNYLKNEAMASVYGKFIHKDSKLDKLRTQNGTLPEMEFDIVNGETKVKLNNLKISSNDLEKLNVSLTTIHRDFEKKLNFLKNKIQNLVNDENIKRNNTYVSELYAHNILVKEIDDKYQNELKAYNQKYATDSIEFQNIKSEELTQASKLKIVIPNEFKEIIEGYLGK